MTDPQATGSRAAISRSPKKAIDQALRDLRDTVKAEWADGEHYEHLRATTCDDANLDYHGPSILYCGGLKWVLAEIDSLRKAIHDA